MYCISDYLICGRVFLRYIQNPLLLKGKKFDVRSYLLIACTCPFVVFFRHGYVRLTCNLYDPRSSDPSTHLTNQVWLKMSELDHRRPSDKNSYLSKLEQ